MAPLPVFLMQYTSQSRPSRRTSSRARSSSAEWQRTVASGCKSHIFMSKHVALLASYFLMAVAGALPATAITVFAAQHERPEFLSTVMSLASLPWCIKGLFGAWSDVYPIWGLHRFPYIVIHCIGYAVSWYMLGAGALEKDWAFALCLFTQSWCIVWVDVLLDGCMVQHVRANALEDGGGKLQSSAWIARSTGSFISSAVGAGLLYAVEPSTVFKLTGLVLLPIAAWSYKLEGDVREEERPNSVVELMRDTLEAFRSTPALRKPTLFLAAVSLVPSVSIALTYFLRNVLHYTPAAFAVLDCVGDLAHVAGALGFKLLLRHMRVRCASRVCLLAIVGLRLAQLLLVCGVTDSLVVASMDEASMAIASEVVAMPVLAITADNTPPHMDSTIYACVLGIANAGAMLSTLVGGVLADLGGVTRNKFNHLWIVIVLTALMGLAPLSLLSYLPLHLQTGRHDTEGSSSARACPATCPRTWRARLYRSTASCARACACCIRGRWGTRPPPLSRQAADAAPCVPETSCAPGCEVACAGASVTLTAKQASL